MAMKFFNAFRTNRQSRKLIMTNMLLSYLYWCLVNQSLYQTTNPHLGAGSGPGEIRRPSLQCGDYSNRGKPSQKPVTDLGSPLQASAVRPRQGRDNPTNRESHVWTTSDHTVHREQYRLWHTHVTWNGRSIKTPKRIDSWAILVLIYNMYP